MKLYLWPALLGQPEVDPRISKVGIVSIHVLRKPCLVRLHELVEMRGILAGHPARRVYTRAFEHRIHAVFRLQAVFDHLELQLSHSAYQRIGIDKRLENLDRALFAQLSQTLLQLLRLHRIP